jgi:hypothetical protein
MNSIRNIYIICSLLILANACDSVISNSAVPEVKETKIVPTPFIEQSEPKFNYTENAFVKIEIQKKSPIQILSVKAVKDDLNFKEGVDVELKNVSDKTIRLVWVALAPQLNCTETSMSGDVTTNQSNYNEKAEIQPSKISVFQISPDLAKGYLVSQKCTKLNPKESTKSMIYISKVEFSDGTNWLEDSQTVDK